MGSMMGAVLRAPGGAGTLVGTQSPLAVAAAAAAVLSQRRGWDGCGDGSREHSVAHGHGVRARLLRAAVQSIPLLCFLSHATSVTAEIYNQEMQ